MTDERGGVGVLSGVVVVVVGTYLPVPDSTLWLIRHEPRCIVSGWLQNVTDTVPIPTPRNSLFRVFRWSVLTVAELRSCVKVVLGCPVLNSPDGLCGRKAATLNSKSDGRAQELCESRGTVAVLDSLSLDIPYDPSGHLKQQLKKHSVSPSAPLLSRILKLPPPPTHTHPPMLRLTPISSHCIKSKALVAVRDPVHGTW